MAANWKMYQTAQDATDFFDQFKAGVQPLTGKCEVVVCPPTLAIPAAVAAANSPRADCSKAMLSFMCVCAPMA